jgi:excisionase family DNA binding protein
MNSMDYERALTTGETARRLGSSRQHVVDLCEQGTLPCYRVGAHRRIREFDLARFVDAQFAAGQGRPSLRREQLLGLWLGRATAGHVARDPLGTLAYARRRLESLRQAGPGASHWLDRWACLIEAGPEAIMTVLTSSDDEAISLRSASPFGGVIPFEERDRIVASFQAFWPLAAESRR